MHAPVHMPRHAHARAHTPTPSLPSPPPRPVTCSTPFGRTATPSELADGIADRPRRACADTSTTHTTALSSKLSRTACPNRCRKMGLYVPENRKMQLFLPENAIIHSGKGGAHSCDRSLGGNAQPPPGMRRALTPAGARARTASAKRRTNGRGSAMPVVSIKRCDIRTAATVVS